MDTKTFGSTAACSKWIPDQAGYTLTTTHEIDFFAVTPQVARFRWVGRASAAEGRILSGVRHAAVASGWKPLPVEWLPETIKRPRCDFPNFHSIVGCLSLRTLEAIKPYFGNAIELLALDGLDGEYVGVHCVRWLDAANMDGVDAAKVSIHSPGFVPALRAEAVAGHHVFGVEGMVTKLFVSAHVKSVIRPGGSRDSSFIPPRTGEAKRESPAQASTGLTWGSWSIMTKTWPSDADGDVLRRLERNGFDFRQPCIIDFNVDFGDWPPPAEALSILAKAFPQMRVVEPSREGRGYVQIQIHDCVSHALVTNIQAEISAWMAPWRGRCDSWGVFH